MQVVNRNIIILSILIFLPLTLFGQLLKEKSCLINFRNKKVYSSTVSYNKFVLKFIIPSTKYLNNNQPYKFNVDSFSHGVFFISYSSIGEISSCQIFIQLKSTQTELKILSIKKISFGNEYDEMVFLKNNFHSKFVRLDEKYFQVHGLKFMYLASSRNSIDSQTTIIYNNINAKKSFVQFVRNNHTIGTIEAPFKILSIVIDSIYVINSFLSEEILVSQKQNNLQIISPNLCDNNLIVIASNYEKIIKNYMCPKYKYGFVKIIYSKNP